MKMKMSLYQTVQVRDFLRKILACCMFSGSLMLLSTTANANQEQLVGLEEKQADLKEQLNRIRIISKIHGEYTLIRDTFYYGESGVINLSTEWNNKVSVWLTSWKVLIGAIEQVQDLRNSEVQENIKDELVRLGADFTKIASLSNEIESKTGRAIEKLGEMNGTPSNWVSGYEQHIELLNSQIQNLTKSFGSAKFSYSNNQRWQEVLSLTDEAVTLMLKKALLQYPELRQAVNRIVEMFDAERLISPEVNKIHSLYQKIRENLLAKRIFHADRLIEEMESQVSLSIRQIRESGIDAEFSNEALSDIESKLDSVKRLRGNLNAFTKGQLVRAYFRSEGRILAAKCRDTEERKLINCELFRRVFSIPEDRIESLSSLELQTIEDQIEQIKRGPIGGLK